MDPALRSPLRSLPLAALIFLAVTLPGTWWWEVAGRKLYSDFFVWLAQGFYTTFGLGGVALAGRERFINLIPFLGLMAATPGLPWRRRAGGTLLGVALIVLSHVLLSGLTWWVRGGLASFPLYVAILCDAIPFLIWAVVACEFLRELLYGALPAAAESRELDSKA
jgi:hypothetical protein